MFLGPDGRTHGIYASTLTRLVDSDNVFVYTEDGKSWLYFEPHDGSMRQIDQEEAIKRLSHR